jgi:hypothetical protein
MNKSGVSFVIQIYSGQCRNPLGADSWKLARRIRDTNCVILFDYIHNYLIILQNRIIL